MKKASQKTDSHDDQKRLLPRLSLFVFNRSRSAAILWLCLTVFGIFSYTTFLKREGFPSINIPYSVISGSYLVDDSKKIDTAIAKPISDIVLQDKRVKTVQSQSQANSYTITAQYKEGTDPIAVGKELQKRIVNAHIMPPQAGLKVETPKLGFTERGDDAVVSVYAKQKGASVEQLTTEANKVAAYIKAQNIPDLESVSTINPFVEGVNPATGLMAKSQTKFDRYGARQTNHNVFYDSVSVGIAQNDGTDVIKMDTHVREALDAYNKAHTESGFTSTLSASYANDIKDQIGELQQALLEGLLAVLVIGSIMIAIRASIVTVIAMVTVLSITIGILYAMGSTLNTITLFALILCLGLIVDDTIIMVEAIDAQRRRSTDPRETVQVATRKVSRAMVAATLTAALSFAPLLFVGGILGSFIRAIPTTVITSLLVSLAVALIFIPLFARYLLLGKKQMGANSTKEVAAGFETKVAHFIGKPMLWARNSRKKLFAVGITALIIGTGFMVAGGFIFQKVTFNIFPPSKDTNGLMVSLNFAPNTKITDAEKVTDRANKIVGQTLGQNFTQASYYSNATNQTASLTINLISYKDREVHSPELQRQLQDQLKGFEGATIKVSQLDAGPPPSAFSVRIQTDNREAAQKLAKDINAFLINKELTRPSGEKAKITETTIADAGSFTRNDGALYQEVRANFDATDTTTLVTLTKTAVQDEFTSQKLQKYGLKGDVLKFDFGQEDDNQQSFKGLVMAFPILLVVIYLLLALQFRSLAQPLLIFMALPFSFFGIALGLYLTDNPFSFFAMLGFFALIGLSIKNTILLTDYANQLRRGGMSAVDAAVGALGERFRPLIATSLTAVASLIPLAIMSPFWEGLAIVLISGLLSSTFLVLTVFPYYYLGAEFLRLHISRKACLLWLGLSVGLSVAIGKIGASPALIPLVIIGLPFVQLYAGKALRKRRVA